jgi:flagellar basal-body rod modification protein FlgD
LIIPHSYGNYEKKGENMGDLIQTVKEGEVQQTQKKTTTKSSGSELGKDAFLQLLTTQMKYQDPLNPNTDTEYISQLATFSQLEQMQNIGTLTSNSQAFGLVGKNVIVKAQNETGETSFINGKVDFVNMAGGKAQLSINGKLYAVDQLDSVIDDMYVIQQGLPGIDQSVKLDYDGSNPKDVTFDVNMGKGQTVADDVAIAINDTILDSDLVSVTNGKVTIDKSAFKDLADGIYKVTVGFNDSLLTTVKGKVTLQIKNSTASNGDDSGSSDGSGSNDPTNGTGDGTTDGSPTV